MNEVVRTTPSLSVIIGTNEEDRVKEIVIGSATKSTFDVGIETSSKIVSIISSR